MTEWSFLEIFMDENIIVRLERDGIVTATFRKLSPDKKQRIYYEALLAFGSNVFDRVVLDDIADSAKISKGSLIQYFSIKENLLGFVSEMVFQNYYEYWHIYFVNETAVRIMERLEQFILSFEKYSENNQAEGKFILGMMYSNSAQLSRQFCQKVATLEWQHIQDIIEEGIRTGQIRRDVKIERLTSLIHMLFTGLIKDRFLYQSPTNAADLEEQVIKFLDLIFKGLK